MAVMTLKFYSEVLGLATSLRILIPTKPNVEEGYEAHYAEKEKLPVLWLLHEVTTMRIGTIARRYNCWPINMGSAW